jgi:bifunctional non-homologous end joining protein LigD
MLPHLRDRPQSLLRHPDGITKPGFFQKDFGGRAVPPGVQTVRVDGSSGAITYLLCQDQASLLSLANLGCIELNPWLSRVGSLDRPDWLVVDLDPEGIPFIRVVEAALAVRRLLDRAGVGSVVKTSGKTGLHVALPLGAIYDYDQARQFAELLAHLVHAELPGTTSVVRAPAMRKRRVYLDYLQNRRAQTLAAPYSVRPVPGACVSTPLQWSEVRRGLDPTQFTIRTLPRRLDRVGDLWAAVLGPGVDLAVAVEKLRKKQDERRK